MSPPLCQALPPADRGQDVPAPSQVVHPVRGEGTSSSPGQAVPWRIGDETSDGTLRPHANGAIALRVVRWQDCRVSNRPNFLSANSAAQPRFLGVTFFAVALFANFLLRAGETQHSNSENYRFDKSISRE